MPNYINIIGDNYPSVEAYVAPGNDPTVYANIVWVSTPISQATLDGLSEKPRYGKTLINFTFGDAAGNPVSITTTTYKKIRSFTFPGKNVIGGRNPSKVIINAYCKTIVSGYIRLYDATNNIEIGNVAVSSISEASVVMTCSNWPATESRFELQGRASGTTNNLYVSSLVIME